MIKARTTVTLLFLLPIVSSCSPPGTTSPIEQQLELADNVEATSGEVLLSPLDAGGVEVQVSQESAMPSLRISAPEGSWDLSRFLLMAMDIQNRGAEETLVLCRINGLRWSDGAAVVPPNGTQTLTALLTRNSPPAHLKGKIFGMNGLPGGYVRSLDEMDPAAVTHLDCFLPHSNSGTSVTISNFRAVGEVSPPSAEEWEQSFVPFVDELGQYKGVDWPEKTLSLAEMKTSTEESDLAQHPGPEEWNEYGGWETGPDLGGSGHFRVEKYEGKWWLIDPSGRLFWSHGIDCVRNTSASPITDRQHYFADLPERTPETEVFFGEGSGAAREYYKGKEYETFDYKAYNLRRKYGEDWEDVFSDLAHRRLRSWGVNTIANWSQEKIYLERRTPYTATIHTGGKPIGGSHGFWRKFPDPFDEGFRKSIAERMEQEKEKTANDPWCIGYFVDNELDWGDSSFLGKGVLASAPDQPAKVELIRQLKAKHRTITALNKAWGSDYHNWNDLVSAQEAIPDGASVDLEAFSGLLADQYFKVCRDEVKRVAPSKLYMGCRFDFHYFPDEETDGAWAIPIAAEFCDIVSFNRYRFSALPLRLPDGIDKPMIIGEFHIGALDRGLLHPGLRAAADQRQRADFYRYYVQSALSNPWLVGTHWFQFNDQPLTGRRDGENYQIGFVDVCDKPHPELVATSRAVGYDLYSYRTKAK